MARKPEPIEALHQLAAVLSVQSLDLRAQYEAKLRILTSIQREIETLRSPSATASQRQHARDELRKRFSQLTAANRDASETLSMIRSAFARSERGQRRKLKVTREQHA